MSNQSVMEIITGLRKKAVEEKPGLLRTDGAYANEQALGVVMELGALDQHMTLTAFIDGEVSLLVFIATGFAVIPAKGQMPHALRARRFTQFAGVHLAEMAACDAFEMANVGETNFYVFSHTGAFKLSVQTNVLGSGKHAFSPLFVMGQGLIAQLNEAGKQQ